MIRQKILLISVMTIMIVTLAGCSSSGETTKVSSSGRGSQENQDEDLKLYTVNGISHAHGLAVDATDNNKLYIATHNGLLLLKNEKDLYRVGDVQDDFMGFSAHPLSPKTFFTSGHPKRGGNLGVQRSDDGGMSWKKIADGVSGPVDFHSMTLSHANPKILYGWYGALQRSEDGGKNWGLIPTTLQKVIALTADSHDENGVYAATASGLKVSKDKGETWVELSDQLEQSVVIALAIDPFDMQKMLSFSEVMGIAVSNDAGKSWKTIKQDIGIVSYLAFDHNKQNLVYSLNRDNSVYRSTDGGESWSFIK